MAALDHRLFVTHPLRNEPYGRLVFERYDGNNVPLYSIGGSETAACGAYEALGRAFAEFGGECFYCGTQFAPQSMCSRKAHRDHVRPKSAGGSALLHNLVIACQKCGSRKANKAIHEYRPKAATKYLEALESHIAHCVRGPR